MSPMSSIALLLVSQFVTASPLARHAIARSPCPRSC
jgi:hypothetical protein